MRTQIIYHSMPGLRFPGSQPLVGPPMVSERYRNMASISFSQSGTYVAHTTLATDSPYTESGVRAAPPALLFDHQYLVDLLNGIKADLPSLIGDAVDSRMATRLSEQQETLTTHIADAKEAMLAKETKSSIVTVNGSVFGFGKVTEALSKTVDLLRGIGGAWRGLSEVGSNVDNVSFPRQLGRAALGGARGTMKIGAAGLGAAVVMSALLATTGLALNKTHDAFPSVPNATSVVASITSQAEKLKIGVGAFEVEKAGGSEVKTLSVQERATALLEQSGNNYGKAIESVNTALGQSYMNDASVETIAKQKLLLTTLQGMQQQAPVAAVPSASGPSL